MIPVTLPLEAERRAEGRMFKAQKIGVRSQKENLFIVFGPESTVKENRLQSPAQPAHLLFFFLDTQAVSVIIQS